MKQSYSDTTNDSKLEYDSESSSDDDERTPLYEQNTHDVSYKSITSTGSVDRGGSITSSVFTLVSTMIGGGLLSLPFAFEQGGLGVASASLIFVLIASTYGGFLIINSKKYCHGKIRNIEDVANVAFGNTGKVVNQGFQVYLFQGTSKKQGFLCLLSHLTTLLNLYRHQCPSLRRELARYATE